MPLPTCECIKGLPQADKLSNIYCALSEIVNNGAGISQQTLVSDIYQAEFWDTFQTDSATIEGRAAPSGQTWAVRSGNEGFAGVFDDALQLNAGHEDDTVYPYVTMERDITSIGCRIAYASGPAATHNVGLVMLIATDIDLNGPFIHLVTLNTGEYRLEWYANGFGGGVTESVMADGAIDASQIRLGEIFNLYATVDYGTGTVTFATPAGPLELTGLTLPTGMRVAVYEINPQGASPARLGMYYTAWCNAVNPLMAGYTVQPWHPTLSALAWGSNATLSRVAISRSLGITIDPTANLQFFNSDYSLTATISQTGADWVFRPINDPTGMIRFYNYFGNAEILRIQTGTGELFSAAIKVGGATAGNNAGVNGTLITVLRHGTATLVGGSVTINDTNVVAGSRIFVNRLTDGGTIGDSYSVTRVAATSFTIQSKLNSANQALDTSVVAWLMINP